MGTVAWTVIKDFCWVEPSCLSIRLRGRDFFGRCQGNAGAGYLPIGVHAPGVPWGPMGFIYPDDRIVVAGHVGQVRRCRVRCGNGLCRRVAHLEPACRTSSRFFIHPGCLTKHQELNEASQRMHVLVCPMSLWRCLQMPALYMSSRVALCAVGRTYQLKLPSKLK